MVSYDGRTSSVISSITFAFYDRHLSNDIMADANSSLGNNCCCEFAPARLSYHRRVKLSSQHSHLLTYRPLGVGVRNMDVNKLAEHNDFCVGV